MNQPNPEFNKSFSTANCRFAEASVGRGGRRTTSAHATHPLHIGGCPSSSPAPGSAFLLLALPPCAPPASHAHPAPCRRARSGPQRRWPGTGPGSFQSPLLLWTPPPPAPRCGGNGDARGRFWGVGETALALDGCRGSPPCAPLSPPPWPASPPLAPWAASPPPTCRAARPR